MPNWVKQLIQTWKMTVPVDPAIKWIVPLTLVGVTGLLLLPGFVLGGFWTVLSATGPAFGLLAAIFVFGRRAEAAAYSQAEGIPGAAGQVLATLRQGWFVEQGIEVNRAQEIVHRVVGRPGVILVVEARPGAAIATSARKKTERWVGDVPVHEFFVGTGEGQLKLRQLNRTVVKLKKVLKPAEVLELKRKLDAVATSPLASLPKGPLPKGMRVPRR